MKQKIQSYTTDGLSQAERFPASLDPDFFKLEERDAGDFLQYLLRLSKHFNFYDLDNKRDGDWEDFFLSDINVVVRIIGKFDINIFIRRYDLIKSKLLRETSDAGLSDGLRELFQFIYEFALFQVKLHSKFAIIPRTEPGVIEFRRITQEYDSYDTELRSLNAWLFYAGKNLGEELNLKFDARETAYLAQQGQNEEEADVFAAVQNKKDKITAAFRNFDSLFSKLRTKYYRLQEAAATFMQKRDAEGAVYAPHMGLLVTFFELYKGLQNSINGINKKHLDHYFHKVLGLAYRKAVADRVYLHVDINPALQKVIVEKGETLVVDKPGITENNIFVTEEDTVLTKAKIRKQLTAYISESVKLASKNDDDADILEQQLFTASNPVTQPGDVLVNGPKMQSWPLMGEDQEDISVDLMTMQPSDIGLLIASPILYAKDGRRIFHIRLYLSESSFQHFRQHAFDYATVSGSHPRIIMHSMLKEAFYLDITGDEGWMRIYRYNIDCDVDTDSERSIDIHFELTGADPATAVYNPLVHGNAYGALLPLVRLKVNNSSFYNPYTFFKGIVLERITIKLEVTGSKQVKLRNNIGELSIVNPFQLFGPQPAVGSYLDIKNTNIFNRYTQDFSVRLHWFDLPRDKGGFHTYYDGYPGDITNDSFKVSLSGLNEGKYYPDLPDQQVYNMFTNRNEPGEKAYLSSTTVIDHVDFLRVRFDNNPSLAGEDAPEFNFKEGAIRFELIEPQDAFGQKIYTALFPEVVMHNGRRFAKKRALPNPPYIPVLKDITIDYVLEYSESLSGLQQDASDRNGLYVWHNYPFGYKKVYPGRNTSAFKLIPDFEQQSNLLLGLEDVVPGEILSLFFKFEENNFNAYNYIPEDVQWSILQDNEWVPVPRADILLDETGNLIRSGMLLIRLPELPGNRNTIMDPSLYWIKASCDNRGFIHSRTIGVFTQVLAATRQLTNENNLTAQELFIPAGTLTQFSKKNAQIVNVTQPFPSFNGREKETEQQFYVRVSEHLRHKNRAITATDIAQLVLETFPEILKVKCFDTEVGGQTIMPGVDLMVVVIPNQVNKELQEFPKVDLSRLFAIRQFLLGVVSPFTSVEVVNPVYERVKVVCSVVFNTDTNVSAAKQVHARESNGILLQRLNNDLKRWIAPWLYNTGANINTEGKIYLSEILNFIKKCPYVSYVTGFSVLHFYQVYDIKTGEFFDRVIDSAIDKREYLKPSLPNSLLVSSSEHSITVLDKPRYVEQEKTGIGGMVIGSELVVADKKEYSRLSESANNENDNDKQYNFYFNTDNV